MARRVDGDEYLIGILGVNIDPTTMGANSLGVKAGGAANDAAVGGVLYATVTAVGNAAGAADTALGSLSLPTNTLAVNGQSLWFEAYGSMPNTISSKTIKVKFGAATLLAVAFGSNTAFTWTLRGRLYRTGSATQKATITLSWSGGTPLTSVANGTATENLASGTPILQVTGAAGAASDVICEAFIVGWDDVNS